MYDIIYNYIHDNVFTGSALYLIQFNVGGLNMDLNAWLSHTATISVMVIFVILLCLLVRWVFRLVSSAFLLR